MYYRVGEEQRAARWRMRARPFSTQRLCDISGWSEFKQVSSSSRRLFTTAQTPLQTRMSASLKTQGHTIIWVSKFDKISAALLCNTNKSQIDEDLIRLKFSYFILFAWHFAGEPVFIIIIYNQHHMMSVKLLTRTTKRQWRNYDKTHVNLFCKLTEQNYRNTHMQLF